MLVRIMSYSTKQNQFSTDSEYALRAARSQVKAAVMTERLSGRQIDFCVLALCSCALTLMCHHAISLGHAPSGSALALRTPSPGILTQLDFNIKSGLVITREESSAEED